ncbi:amino acid adenylation domain-containing protein [Microbulbifer halophilus]|uniref:Amino acid adenylation domain-containing protein n=1 Tax=Microbulbifer halophilus TaxID=453963 RepID=A0ABW5EJ18_9GAMM|nr:amino acid adenylation domain-containing protein [Microbulbifer halophilus]MCW8127990.1 amino acid adenylation domain-containing protein [Microbulbifer halophilus]
MFIFNSGFFGGRDNEALKGNVIIDDTNILTYDDVRIKSNAVANFLIEADIKRGDLVPIISERSAYFVIAMLGIVKAGGIYIPVDDRNPEPRKNTILECSKARICLLSGGAKSGYIDDSGCRVAYIENIADDYNSKPVSIDVSASQAVYVVFTSGTTGTPKGVVVEYGSLDNIIKWHNETFLVKADSRMVSTASVGFDVFQWEVWSSLASGACLYIPSDEVRLDPGRLLEFFSGNEISHAYVPTAMVPDIVKNSKSNSLNLKYLFTAGEKLQPLNTDHISYSVVDYYGPAEATIFATCNIVESSSKGVPDSIGYPVADTEIYILDENLDVCPENEHGEIFIAGTCLARGYLHDPDLTCEKFFNHPSAGNKRIYRTGDFGKWLSNGKIQFIGRIDDQIKIRGNRVEMGEITSFLNGQEEVERAVVIAEDTDKAGKQLIAFVVKKSDYDSMLDISISLRNRISAYLPGYMVPADILVIDRIPLTVNGKSDRSALLEIYQEYLRKSVADNQFSNPEELKIAEIWRNILGRERFGPDDDFFNTGGHSLLAARVMKSISEVFEVKTYIRDIYEYKTVRMLSEAISNRAQGFDTSLDREPVIALTDDVFLPEGIEFGEYSIKQISDPENILLTGATGFVGAHMLAELLSSTDSRIHCLVRGIDNLHARKRLDNALKKYLIRLSSEDVSRVEVYASDVSESYLGMEENVYRELSRTIDIVYHSASSVNFIQPYTYMKHDNVEGVRRIITFASDYRVKPLMLFSTISVYSWGHIHTGKKVVSEDDDIDQNLPAVVTDIGYVRSKWVMEKVADLAADNGLPLMTFRLGYATLNSQTGLCADYQWWGRFVKSCIDYNAIPDLDQLREGLTTVDYMVRAISFITRNPEAIGKKFNLIHRDENNLTLKEFFNKLDNYFDFNFKVIPYKSWRNLWENDSDSPLYPLLSLFRDNMYDGLSTVELYQNTYRWKCDNVAEFLRGSGIEEPEFDRELMSLYLERLMGVSYKSVAVD